MMSLCTSFFCRVDTNEELMYFKFCRADIEDKLIYCRVDTEDELLNLDLCRADIEDEL